MIRYLAGLMLAASTLSTRETVRIAAPSDGASVAAREIVDGTAPTSGPDVWVVVHPLSGDYWVQRPGRADNTGRWRIEAAFGEPGPQHAGQQFEVMAVIRPKATLTTGMVLAAWPKAQLVSPIVRVVRR